MVVDHYEDDWSRLGYILLMGTAELIFEGREHEDAVRLLRRKYSQYRTMDVDANPVIKITPQRVVCWGAAPTSP